MNTHSRVRRIAWRSGYRLLKWAVSCIALIDSRLYMTLYVPLLRCYGMKLSGVPRYIAPDTYFDDFSKITLGDRVVISAHVTFLTHDYSLTTALIAIGAPPATDVASQRDIFIGNNVFIGLGSIILPNAVVEDNAIIGAGSVVRGRITAGSIVIGNPAHGIGSVAEYAARWVDRLETDEVRYDSR